MRRLYRPIARFATVAALGLAASLATAASAEEVYTPSPDHDLATLGDLVQRRLPRMQGDLLATDLARAEARQARLLPNPSLDVEWATIPLGRTNPPDLAAPMANVPSYTVGASYTFPLGKREPRRARADAFVDAARHGVADAARLGAVALVRVLGRLAVARLRLEGLLGFADQQRAMIELAHSRLQQGFGTPLDVDRLEIELARIEQQVLSTRGDEQASLAACASYVGTPCRSFPSGAAARTFVETWLARTRQTTGDLARRPDVLALDANRRAAVADASLSRAQAIPDPTVRLAYTHDQFVVSGNQANSLTLSVSIPVPVFDHGQAQADAADARRARYEKLRETTIRTSTARSLALLEVLALLDRRRQELARTLPRAEQVLRDLQTAANSRLIPLTDVLQARRILDELLMQEADTYGDAFQASADYLEERAP